MAKKRNKVYQPMAMALLTAVNKAGAKMFGVNVWAAFVDAAIAEVTKLSVIPKKPRENALLLVALFLGLKYGIHMQGSDAVRDDVEIVSSDSSGEDNAAIRNEP
jgi:hypothetical protein